MTSTVAEPVAIESARLIKDLLGVDAVDLSLMKTANGMHCGDALCGLGVLMRRVLELAAEIDDDECVAIRLVTEQTARPEWRARQSPTRRCRRPGA